MHVTLNGEPVELREGTTVATVVAGLGRPQRGVAVAVDARIVPRSAWAATTLADGARVEVLTAAQGG